MRDFTRDRALTFARVALLVLRGHKLSLQNALNKVFTALGEAFRVPTGSAYSQARLKLEPELFVHLNGVVCRDFYHLYEADGLVERWRGHRLLGCDGTYLTVPDTAATRVEFDLQVNQYERAACVQAQAVVLYDLRNELALAACLGRRQGETQLLRTQLWAATAPGDVLVLDRLYADYALLAWAASQGRHFVVRLPRRRYPAARAFWHDQSPEQVVELACPARARVLVAERGLPERLRLRLVRVSLEGGTTEVLLTSLLDQTAYPAADFKQVYGWRWGEETFFARVKTIFEVERFSGLSPLAIRQDFSGVLFLASLESVLRKPDEQALKEESQQRGARTTAQVNHAVSYLALVERAVQLLAGSQPTEAVLAELHHLLRTSPTRARPNRRVERPTGPRHAFRLRFHKYVKRLLA